MHNAKKAIELPWKGKLMKKLAAILKNVKLRTDLEISVFSDDMRYSISEGGKPPILPDKSDFTQIYVSSKQNRTFFKFRYSGINYTGSIQGADKTSENYAFLILSLVENYSDETEGLSFSETVKRIVTGEISSRNVEVFVEDNKIPDMPCFCLAVSQEKAKIAEVYNYLNSNFRSTADLITLIDNTTVAYVKISDADTEGFSQAEFAKKIHSDIYENTGIKTVIGVGVFKENLLKANTSFKEAVLCLRANGILFNNSSVRLYRDFALIRLLEDIPKYRLKELSSVLLSDDAQAIFADDEMLRTVEVLMENDLNLSESSRSLYVHRNTLTYRLDKIERVTNLDVRKFSDACTFKILSVIKKITD